MVFSSLEFILIFLPLAYLGFLVAGRLGGWNLAIAFIGLASLVFYAQFSVMLAAVLLTSVVFNYLVGYYLIAQTKDPERSGIPLALGVSANLLALGYFKYTNFFIDVINQSAGTGYSTFDIILPVGISFYTFIQIGYLIEAHGGQVKQQPFSRYLAFSTFFPCVTAGPLVLQGEIFSQMEGRKDHTFEARRFAVGITLFAMGLFKKVVLADTIAPYANFAFDGVAEGQLIGMADAWMGTLAYTFQLYFDFSGYSDMAIGLGAIFGIKLPLNFNSPFKATSISDFWRRWHITMSRFFATYLYNPMAMSGMRMAMKAKLAPLERYLSSACWPVFFTMFIAGIWHGAGWTFVIYGSLHGTALAVDHAWNYFKMPRIPSPVGWLATMAVVVTGLVIFRATDMDVALSIMSAMWGLSEISVWSTDPRVHLVASEVVPYLAAFVVIVLAFPNTQQILSNEWVSSDTKPENVKPKFFPAWNPDFAWTLAVALVFATAITTVSSDGSFLYYQF